MLFFFTQILFTCIEIELLNFNLELIVIFFIFIFILFLYVQRYKHFIAIYLIIDGKQRLKFFNHLNIIEIHLFNYKKYTFEYLIAH